MRELSLNILDICKNSTKAGATYIYVGLETKDNLLTITITDNGCGMSEEFVRRVLDPFTTTRTTRKVGMGLPLFKQEAEQAGGSLTIRSKVSVGTEVKATFVIDSIDRMPLGDFASTVSLLVLEHSDIHFVFEAKNEKDGFKLDTNEVCEIMGGIPLSEPEVLNFIKEFITDNIQSLYGGNI